MPDIFVAKNNKDAPSLRKGTSLNTVMTMDKKGMGLRYEGVAERLIKERKIRWLSAFNIMPRRTRFENQEAREKIILLLRQHWITQAHWVAGGIAGLMVPLIFNWVPVFDFLSGNYQFMVMIIWYLLLTAFIYENFIDWYYQVFIITDERIIDINFTNLIYKQLSEAKIDNIEDVTYTQGGVLRAMLNYGEVSMQTAGTEREFVIEAAPDPNKIVKILNELKLEEEHEKIIGKVR